MTDTPDSSSFDSLNPDILEIFPHSDFRDRIARVLVSSNAWVMIDGERVYARDAVEELLESEGTFVLTDAIFTGRPGVIIMQKKHKTHERGRGKLTQLFAITDDESLARRTVPIEAVVKMVATDIHGVSKEYALPESSKMGEGE